MQTCLICDLVICLLYNRPPLISIESALSIQMVNQFCAKLTNFEYAFNVHQKLSASSTHSITDNKGNFEVVSPDCRPGEVV